MYLIRLLQGPVRVDSGGEVSLKIFGIIRCLVSCLMCGGEMAFGEEETVQGSHRSEWPSRGPRAGELRLGDEDHCAEGDGLDWTGTHDLGR